MELIIVFAAMVGFSVGSFLNVVIYRAPRGLSIVKPGSFCPACSTPIKPWHNVPVLSYLMLRGKCAYCGRKISPRYPLVETLTAFLTVFPLFYFGISWMAVAGILLGWHLTAIAFIDYDTNTISDYIVLPMGVLGLLTSWFSSGWTGVAHSIAAVAIGGGMLLLLFLISKYVMRKQGVGGGDVTLVLAFSTYLRSETVLLSLFIGALVTLFVSVAWSIVKRKSLYQVQLPFGPGLAIGAWITFSSGKVSSDGISGFFLMQE